jgi:hypothetical protein
MKAGGSLSIWFFVGLCLGVNGALILGASVYQFFHPPQNPVVLFKLHSGIWWGGLLTVIGLVYCIYYAPGKGRS